MINETARRLGSNRSCIRELFEYGNLRAAQVGRENVYDYSLGNPSIPAPPQVAQTVRELLDRCDPLALHGYTSAGGNLQVRQAIADDLNARFCADALPEELFLTAGAAPALTAVLGALASPGAEVLAIAPCFPEYRVFAEGAGLAFRMVPPMPPAFRIPMKRLEAMLTPRTRAILLNSPNNPSGVIYSRTELERLGEILSRAAERFGHPIYIISDEPYRELAYDGLTTPWLPGIYRDTVVCYSWSKSLSLPGERIGYVYVPRRCAEGEALYAAVAGAARAMGHVCAPSLWQQVIARCVGLRPDLQAYDENRRLLWDSLTAMGYEMAEPSGAFYLFIKAPGGDANAFSQRAKARDLLLVPGDGFGCPGYFRVCYCVSREMILRSLPVFRSLLEEE